MIVTLIPSSYLPRSTSVISMLIGFVNQLEEILHGLTVQRKSYPTVRYSMMSQDY